MRRAFERCGPSPASAGYSDHPGAARRSACRAGAGRAAGVSRAGPRAAAAAGLAPAGGNTGCVGACERRHQACRATQCGREPTQSTQYQRYQGCLSDCPSRRPSAASAASEPRATRQSDGRLRRITLTVTVGSCSGQPVRPDWLGSKSMRKQVLQTQR